jgi:FkbM family methyltransferase
MIPRRLRNLRPYFASLVHPRFNRPPLGEMARWIAQPGKEKRASSFIEKRETRDDFLEVRFHGFAETFYYPVGANWIDLCQTIDEVFNPKNWHHFVSDETPLRPDDTVVDCGAAEGLFTYFAAKHVAKIYAIEPIPMWHAGLAKTFAQFANIETLKVGVGHRDASMRMTDDEIYSRVSASGNLEIPIATLDTLFAAKDIPVSFLKADIEGFEFPMLLGAEEVIRRNRPRIALTVYHDANNFLEIQDYLRNLHADYRFRLRGIAENGNPVLLQAY